MMMASDVTAASSILIKTEASFVWQEVKH